MTNPKSALTFLLLTSVLVPMPAQGQVSFFWPPTYAASAPLFVADFNGDGKLDFLGGGNGVLELGTGNGTFTIGTTVSGGAVAVADFNGDGKPDILQQSNGSLRVLLGNGDGTFQKPISTVIGLTLSFIAAGDLGGAGGADVIGISDNTLTVYLGKGDGTFTAPGVAYALPANTSVFSILLGDVNGDGKTDITLIGNNVTVFLGNGDGTLKAPIISSGVPSGCDQNAAEGDFNGDGKVDLAIGNGSECTGSGGATILLLGNGDGTFQASTIAIPEVGGPLAAADLNGDGKLDLVINNAGQVPEIYLGNGDGTFSYRTSYFPGVSDSPAATPPVVADFGPNGKPDILVDNVLLLGNGDGTFQGVNATPVPAGLGGVNGSTTDSIATGDFFSNGQQDVAVIGACSTSAPSCVYILMNNTSSSLTLTNTYPLQQAAYAIATADLNGDNKLDLVVTGQDPTTQEWSYSVLLGNGYGTFQTPAFYAQSVIGTPSAFVIADFNNDHKPDLAIALGANASNSLAVLLGNGDGTFGSPTYVFDAGASTVVTADFNGDGNADLAVGATAGTGLLLGHGDGSFQPVVFPPELINLAVEATADFNNDGRPDLLFDGQIGLGNGDATFTVLPNFFPPSNHGFNSYAAFPPVADFNGDGNLDVSGSKQTGSEVDYGFFLGNGNGTFGQFVDLLYGQSHYSYGDLFLLGAADINGDGRPDLLLSFGPQVPAVVVLTNTTPASFRLSASALSPLPVTAGSSATSTVTVKPTFGFNGAVTLSCTGLPSGASCAFSPLLIAHSSGTSNVTVTTSSSTAAGTYAVKIQGSSGAVVQSTTVSLVVQTPVFSLTAAPGSPTSQSIHAGQSADFSLVVTPSGGFSGTVALSCSITPAATSAPTCHLPSASVQISSSVSQPVEVTIKTIAPVTTAALSPVSSPWGWIAFSGTSLLLSLGWLVPHRRRTAFGAPILALAVTCWVGCGGGGGSASSPTATGTPAGTYMATVTATSGTVSKSVTLTVTVK